MKPISSFPDGLLAAVGGFVASTRQLLVFSMITEPQKRLAKMAAAIDVTIARLSSETSRHSEIKLFRDVKPVVDRMLERENRKQMKINEEK